MSLVSPIRTSLGLARSQSEMQMADVKQEVRRYLEAHRARATANSFSDQDSLLEVGVIDSMIMVDLIAHLEKTYHIRVDEDDMVPENFDSIEAISAYIESKRAG